MCATCGCSDDSHISMTIPGKEPVHYHTHENGVLHTHAHVHSHSHGHIHKHNHEPATSTTQTIDLEQKVLNQNQLAAERNRGYFDALNIKAINLVSSPGSGKTTLLEKTLTALNSNRKIAVIEGDQQTSNDAERIAQTNTPVIQVNTGRMCHLDAEMIREASKALELDQGTLLFIENVGNLVCPAMFDLGESRRVVVISVTEGTDKAIKYPEMFHTSSLCIINKTDLLPYVDFDVESAKEFARSVNPDIEFIETSATTGSGMEGWIKWLESLN